MHTAGTTLRTNTGNSLRNLLSPATASAIASDNLNFQARLQTASGAIVPDGYYNIEFKLYSGSTGGSALWTGTRAYNSGVGACTGPVGTNDCRVRVVNGYVSVYLGSITSFPSTIPWDQQLYLTLNVAGTTSNGLITYDGEMTPRLKLTAVPYAMQARSASQIQTSSGANLATLTIAAPTSGNQTFVIQDQGAAGMYTLLTQEGAGTALAGSFIQNQNSAAQTANLWITGTAKAETSITVGKTTVQGVINLHDGSGSQGTVKLAPQTGNFNFTIPVASANDIFCLQSLANCPGTGVTSVGALDGGVANASGATITGTTVYLQSANASYAGLVNTATQMFAGNKTFNGNIILAAGTSLTITGGNTASRPGSPTEGMVYYDTDTMQILVYSNGKWQGDRTTSTKIVAASNSSQSVKDSADYIADGTDDEVEINAALVAAAGGKVYLAEGIYTITASIIVPNNTTLTGAGRGTVITIPNSFNASIYAITNGSSGNGTGVTIQDLRLEGNRYNQTSGTMNGIVFNGVGTGTGSSAVQGGKIANVWANNWYAGDGIFLTASSNNTLTGNNVQGNYNSGIHLYNSPHNTLTSNNVQGNNFNGIYVENSPNNTITGNTSQGNSNYGIILSASYNNTLTGNTTQGNYDGIFLNGSVGNTLTGNTTQGNNGSGISIYNGSYYNTVVGNTVGGNLGKGIKVTASSWGNIISSNNIYDSGDTTTNDGIYLSGAGQSNTITNNRIADNSATTNNYAINIAEWMSSTNYLADNTLGGGSINDLGTGTIYGGQLNVSGNYVIQPAGTIDLMKNTNITGTITGISSLTLGTSSTTNGTIILKNSTNANTVTLQSAAQTGSYTLSIPILTNNDTICTVTLNNCVGSGGGANTSLSNLVSVNIGATALNSTSSNLNLTTTTSGNIVLSSAGTIELQDNTNVTGALIASSTVQGTRLISTVATGTSPLQVASTTLVTNLNADFLDGQAGSYYQNASNISAGTINDARLSTNVVLLNSTQTITGAKTFTAATTSFTGSVDVGGTLTAGNGVGEAAIEIAGGSTGSQKVNFSIGGSTNWVIGSVGGGLSPQFQIQRFAGGVYAESVFSILNSTGDITTTDNMAVGGGLTSVGSISAGPTSQRVTIGGGAGNHSMEFGRTDGAGSTPFIDFHSGVTATDYDSRIIASGGNGAAGGGTIQLTAATTTISGALNANGDLQGNGKTVARTTDAWLRINPDNDFTAGTYYGTGLLRTDGALQVGSSGAVLNVTGAGTFSLNATNFDINTSGIITTGSINWAGNITTTGDVTASTMYATAFIANNGVFRNMNGAVRAIQISSFSNTHAMLQIGDAAGQIDFYTTYKCQIGNTASMTCTSDSRKKNIIGTAGDNLVKIMQLQPTYYTMKSDTSNRLQLGLIAQNVQTQFPTAVVTGDDGYLQLDYGSLVSPLIGAVQEQQAQINELKTSVASLQASNGLVNGGTISGNITINGNLMVNGTITIAQNALFQQNVTVAGELHTSDIYVGGHLVSNGVAPQVAVGSALGSGQGGANGPTAVVDGTDNTGTVHVVAGVQNVVSGSLAHITFNKAFTGTYKVIMSASNDNAAFLRVYTTKTATGFDIVARDTAQAGTDYQFDYIVIGVQ